MSDETTYPLEKLWNYAQPREPVAEEATVEATAELALDEGRVTLPVRESGLLEEGLQVLAG